MDQPPNRQMSKAARAMQSLLGSRVICTLSDGRQTAGFLVCIDRLKNLVLSDCLETRVIVSTDYNMNPTRVTMKAQRHLQQAMVPGAHLVKVEIDRQLYDQKVLPILQA
jgi:small nuclear ribonucleoprotein (snRNP)-like protein